MKPSPVSGAGPVNPAKAAPVAPDIKPDFKASPILPPLINVPRPDPSAAPNTGPRPVIDSAIGKITGATFLKILITFLTTFLKLLHILEKKPNSISPVSGLMEFALLPTTYCSGSSIPLSRNLLKICSFKAGLFSIRLKGTTISPVWMCATLSSPKRPWPAILLATAVNCAKPSLPNSFSASLVSRVSKSSSDMA